MSERRAAPSNSVIWKTRCGGTAGTGEMVPDTVSLGSPHLQCYYFCHYYDNRTDDTEYMVRLVRQVIYVSLGIVRLLKLLSGVEGRMTATV